MEPNLRQEIHQLHAGFCKGLADANRLVLLYTLDNDPCTVGELAEKLDLPQSTVSRHLGILRERGMVVDTRQGKSVLYALGDPRIIEALDILRAVMSSQLKKQIPIVRAIG
ncbi:MAG TPA: metalloregulator ArsR/SmtB family transcription factor [Anaerolineales bacterium]|nr:metalloregulator ArsR/SmtB family transcription factor [Anaerolineales bacterium]